MYRRADVDRDSPLVALPLQSALSVAHCQVLCWRYHVSSAAAGRGARVRGAEHEVHYRSAHPAKGRSAEDI